MTTCVINFSARRDGNCFGIADFVYSKYQGSVVRFDFCDYEFAPCGKCNYECFEKREYCPHFKDGIYSIYESIINSDICYFIIPNYCDYPCSLFFAFNERSQCRFQGDENALEKYLAVKKKFICVSNSNEENFINALRYHIEENDAPNTLFLSAKKYGKSGICGDLCQSSKALHDIEKFIKT